MHIPHAFWLPEPSERFVQPGGFRLWVETAEGRRAHRGRGVPAYPFALGRDDWPGFLESLGLRPATRQPTIPCPVLLPGAATPPLPSPQLARAWPEVLDVGRTELRPWRVETLSLEQPVR